MGARHARNVLKTRITVVFLIKTISMTVSKK
jgi:hypothetical protein